MYYSKKRCIKEKNRFVRKYILRQSTSILEHMNLLLRHVSALNMIHSWLYVIVIVVVAGGGSEAAMVVVFQLSDILSQRILPLKCLASEIWV